VVELWRSEHSRCRSATIPFEVIAAGIAFFPERPAASTLAANRRITLTAVSELLYAEAIPSSGLFPQEKATLYDSGNGYINSETALNFSVEAGFSAGAETRWPLRDTASSPQEQEFCDL
jgi:hypothetical protein